jgi:uncharacterized membrane protein YgcG
MRLATALLALLLWLPLASHAQQLAPIPALDSPVVDTTGTLDAAQKQALVQQAMDLQQRKGSQLQVLVVPTTQPEDIAQYTTRVFDQWQIGRKGVDDGVLLVVAKDDRRVRIEPGYGLEGAIPDAIANRVIQEYLVPRFRSGDYAGGITDATAVLVKLIDGERCRHRSAAIAGVSPAVVAIPGSWRCSSACSPAASCAACSRACRVRCAACSAAPVRRWRRSCSPPRCWPVAWPASWA